MAGAAITCRYAKRSTNSAAMAAKTQDGKEHRFEFELKSTAAAGRPEARTGRAARGGREGRADERELPRPRAGRSPRGVCGLSDIGFTPRSQPLWQRSSKGTGRRHSSVATTSLSRVMTPVVSGAAMPSLPACCFTFVGLDSVLWDTSSAAPEERALADLAGQLARLHRRGDRRGHEPDARESHKRHHQQHDRRRLRQEHDVRRKRGGLRAGAAARNDADALARAAFGARSGSCEYAGAAPICPTPFLCFDCM